MCSRIRLPPASEDIPLYIAVKPNFSTSHDRKPAKGEKGCAIQLTNSTSQEADVRTLSHIFSLRRLAVKASIGTLGVIPLHPNLRKDAQLFSIPQNSPMENPWSVIKTVKFGRAWATFNNALEEIEGW